jgi:N-methylhydantoinase A/oxoprolinase/acetone carboxylase beta subunit
MTITRRADVSLAEIDVALATLTRMVTRAVNAYDLPNVKHFLERIDEVLEARMTLTRDYASTSAH